MAASADEPKAYPSCTREPTTSDVSAAKGAFEAGEVSFQEADYDRSILYWEDAFRRDCTAVKLLTNLARAYELSGKKQSAINALETFLQRRPESPDRPSIEKRIAVLKKQVQEEKAATVAAPPAAPVEEKPAPAQESPAPEAEPAGAPRKPKWPIYMTGAGALVLALGVPIWVDGQSKVDFYKTKCPLTTDDPPVSRCQSDAEHTANEYQQLGTNAVQERNFGVAATVVGGGVAVAGAIVWYVLWNRDEPAATATHFVPVVTPTYSGFSLSGAF